MIPPRRVASPFRVGVVRRFERPTATTLPPLVDRFSDRLLAATLVVAALAAAALFTT